MIPNTLIERFPELEAQEVREMYDSSKRLVDFGDELASKVIYCALKHMASMVGGISYFWKKEEAKVQFICWNNGLKYYNCKQIFNTLLQVVTCKVDHVPRNPMEFSKIVTNGVHHRLAPSVEETMRQPIFGQAQICGENPGLAEARNNEAHKKFMQEVRAHLR